MATPAFPNATEIPVRLPLTVWRALRLVVLAGALALAGALVVSPDDGLFALWRIAIPLLPLIWLVAPGLWRNLCPLASSNQTPRLLGLSLERSAPGWLRRRGFLIGATGFVAFVSLRKLGLDDDGPASALLLLGAMGGGYVGGTLLKGKSGWCSSVCPLLPVQRLYGQTPYRLVANNHCQPCIGCTANCYDFNPRVAYLADLAQSDEQWRGYRTLFAGLFPGLVVAFFQLPEARGGEDIAAFYGQFALYLAVSLAAFVTLDTVLRVSTHKVTTLFGAVGFSLFYWYGGPPFVDAVAGSSPDPATWAVRGAALALALGWVARTYAKERAFVRERTAAAPGAAGAAAPAAGLAREAAQRTQLSRRALGPGAPEVRFVDADRRVSASAGMSLLEAAEAGELPIEAGCRMGMCGADPVCVKAGAENLSAITDDERRTLERLGLAPNTRMACCARVSGPVEVSLTPERPPVPSPSRVRGFPFDRSVRRVVIVGNGIAGVTAADHVRRRHPLARIDLVAVEPHHLYNRMGIARLIHGRSAMQGLYLNPDGWYDERAITTWLNTAATALDRDAQEIVLGTGQTLPYDRLILATGSQSFVPPIGGVQAPGCFVLRSAADALGVRAFAQRHHAHRAVVAGGGLLGLEAAHALAQLGLRTTVLERGGALLSRQLDARGGALLRSYLEQLGLRILVGAQVDAALATDGRLRGVGLAGGGILDADVLLIAAGIQPNVGLARWARLDVGRGVRVDDRMRTSDARILAAGDVAEHRGGVAGLWPVAVDQAEVAAENAVGGERLYEPSPPLTMLKVVGVELTSIGRIHAGPGDEEIVLDPGDGTYRKLVIADGRIAGAILLGRSDDVAAVRTALERGHRVDGALRELRAGRWSVLAALSGERPLLAASPA